MTTYRDIANANRALKRTPIKGKDYTEVHQRVKGFRMVYPDGFIRTELVSDVDGVCVYRAVCGFIDDSGNERIISTGTAQERQDGSYINNTSYIENCETSAVGRCLGFAGFGIDSGIASYEETENAQLNQKKVSAAQLAVLKKHYTGEALQKVLTENHVERLDDLTVAQGSNLIRALNK